MECKTKFRWPSVAEHVWPPVSPSAMRGGSSARSCWVLAPGAVSRVGSRLPRTRRRRGGNGRSLLPCGRARVQSSLVRLARARPRNRNARRRSSNRAGRRAADHPPAQKLNRRMVPTPPAHTRGVRCTSPPRQWSPPPVHFLNPLSVRGWPLEFL